MNDREYSHGPNQEERSLQEPTAIFDNTKNGKLAWSRMYGSKIQLLWESTAYSFLLLPVHTYVRIIFFLLAFFKLMRGNLFFFSKEKSGLNLFLNLGSFSLVYLCGNHLPLTLHFLQGDTFKDHPFSPPRGCCSPELGLRTMEF